MKERAFRLALGALLLVALLVGAGTLRGSRGPRRSSLAAIAPGDDRRPAWCRQLQLFSYEKPQSIWARSADDVWMTTFTLRHWDGHAWTLLPKHEDDAFFRVSGNSASDAWCTGLDDEHTAIFHWENGKWTETGFPKTLTAKLMDVWGASAIDAWAVGRGYPRTAEIKGIILHRDSRGWRLVYDEDLFVSGVWGTSSNDVWFAGEHGQVRHWDGKQFSFPPRRTAANLNRVWGTGPEDLWIVGDEGTVLHFEKGVWALVASGATGALSDISGTGPSDVWFVGDAGVFHWDGVVLARAQIDPRRIQACGPVGAETMPQPWRFHGAFAVAPREVILFGPEGLASFRSD